MLRNLDEITVFDLDSGRTAVVEPILEELRLQGVYGQPAQEVGIGGMVRAPGTYPLEEGMRVSDLIRAGAFLTDSAYGLSAEITRYNIIDGERREAGLIQVDLGAVLAGDPAADIVLEPFDYLNVKQISQWREQATVELTGEVKFPGSYPIRIGETLREVVERAGGLTSEAFPEGSVFIRLDLQEREKKELDRLLTRLEADLASMTLQATRAAVSGVQTSATGSSLSVGQSILAQLRKTEPVGRLVIDLPAALSGDPAFDIILEDGDELYVPDVTQEVTVIGEVQYSTSHLYNPAYDRDDYIRLSGGLTVNADDERVYIVRANGAVVAGSGGSKWFSRGSSLEIRPGDTVVAPLDVDRIPGLALWQSSTTILYNLAIAVAAIGSL
ncbi:MAG: SLBB domain-containing protein [Gammaproteobacteria bacterium]